MKDVRFTLTPRHTPKLYTFFLRSREQESRDQTENSYKIMRNNTEPHFKHCTPIRFRELVILLEIFDNSFTFLKYFNLNVKKYRNKKIVARKIRIEISVFYYMRSENFIRFAGREASRFLKTPSTQINVQIS